MINSQLIAKAKVLDVQDPLKHFRSRFFVPNSNIIYLDGNSLGRLPANTAEHIQNVVTNEWGTDLIDSWNKSWYTKSLEIGDKIAELIGAEPGEVVITDNTSINLYKLARAAIMLQQNRHTILSDDINFPSDLYILQGIAEDAGHPRKLKLVQSADGISVSEEAIREALNSDTALLSLTHVAFKSAFMHDISQITKFAQEVGALVLWDLSHSVGAVPLDVKGSNVDMAVGCTYKYLNGGPGAPAFLYVRKDLQDELVSPVRGWFGDARPFDFSTKYQPADGIRRFLTGTPPILSMLAIENGVDLLREAGMDRISEKSRKLSEFFIELLRSELPPSLGFRLNSPEDASKRGSHVSVSHEHAYRITKALLDETIGDVKVVPDFRSPQNIRFGFAPLYNTFRDICQTIEKLKLIVESQVYTRFNEEKDQVT